MRCTLNRYGIVILLVVTLLACSKVPHGILSEKKMQAVQTDMQIAEAMISEGHNDFQDDAQKEALYESIFHKHGISQADYDTALVWYGRHLDVYIKVYDRILADLDQREKELGKDAGFSLRSDSINIWTNPSFIMFSRKALCNGVVFSIKPEMGYPSGSVFVMGMNVWGLNNKLRNKPNVHMCADLGDTTVVMNEKIQFDGYHKVILRSIPGKAVQRVYGYIFMNNSNEDYNKIYVDSLNLIRYDYGSAIR